MSFQPIICYTSMCLLTQSIFCSELHWHKTAEWAYVLKGTAQISTVNPDGQNYVKNVVRLRLCALGLG